MECMGTGVGRQEDLAQVCYDRLTPEQIEDFEKLPPSMIMHYQGFPDFVICHGSPWKTNESMREDYEYIDELTKRLETELTICAHFHIQSQYIRKSDTVYDVGGNQREMGNRIHYSAV